MLLHVRRVIILDPDGRHPQRGACIFSTAMRWAAMAGTVEDRARPDTIERYGNVLATTFPDEVLEEIENGFSQYSIDVCERCSTLDECDEYETQAEKAAESMRLLSGAWVGSNWAWVAPSSVLELSKVTTNASRSAELQEMMGSGKKQRISFSLEGLRSFFVDVLADENRHLRELAKGAKKRLRRKVKDSAGSAAAAFVEEAFDAATDIGAQKLRDAFSRNSERRYRRPDTASSTPVDPAQSALEAAEAMLDLKWPYSKEDLEVSYRIQAKKHHPDIAGPAGAERMAQINVARDRIRSAREW